MIDNLIRDSKHIVIFTGAGMSTESGVPDFRSNSGLWKGESPEMLASLQAMEKNQKEFVNFYIKRIEALQNIKPHIGYELLSRWSENYNVKAVITQNTDGLHEQAGNENVIPLHGNIQKLHCHRCHTVYPKERYFNREVFCSCGGMIRPSVVLFGEPLNAEALCHAQEEAEKADLFVVLGSSLVVSPANLFPQIAKENGAKLVIVNHDATPLDALADIVVNDRKIGEFMQEETEVLLSF